jgi:GH15 family glucan-1,4-alpha-glucosidase
MDLLQRSVDIILAHQSESGAYVACPTFPTYRFCWFRDASYVAYAMDLVGRHDSAARFHAWATRTILAHRDAVRRGLDKARRGLPLAPGEYIHTRYHLDGVVETDGEWPNFQLDGLGTWLWSLSEHLRLTGHALSDEQQRAVELCVDYLIALWDRPCYDCWEERPESLHTYTLGALHRGLACFADIRSSAPHAAARIKETLQARSVLNGHFIKDLDGADEVDGNLVALAMPHALVAPHDPLMRATISRIESDLRCGDGGVHRYAADAYYGGGEWVLLTAWLGWYYAEVGEVDRARQLQKWIGAQADEQGHMPEQVAAHLNRPAHLGEWRARWGESARPLLWSHAAYIILHDVIRRSGAERP